MREKGTQKAQVKQAVTSSTKDTLVAKQASSAKQTTLQKKKQSEKSQVEVQKQQSDDVNVEETLKINSSQTLQEEEQQQIKIDMVDQDIIEQDEVVRKQSNMQSQLSQELVNQDQALQQNDKAENELKVQDNSQIVVQTTDLLKNDDQEENQEKVLFLTDIKQQEEEIQLLEVVDSKYGDQKIDLSDLHQNLHELQSTSNFQGYQNQDPSRPTKIVITQTENDEPLPSYSNRVNIGEFSVGNYKEFKLREELAGLIEKYNKQFYGEAKRPIIRNENPVQEKQVRYRDKMIVNPIAVPNPGQSEGNYSWMCLMTPHYNQLVKDINTQQLENHVLHQHFEYYLEIEKEKQLLDKEFEQLKQAENRLQSQLDNELVENNIMQDKVDYMERNINYVIPERFREMNEKVENLNNILRGKDNVIDQLIHEINLIKNEKDDVQNEVLFKKQRIDNLNMEFNTKEIEYQRLWEEQQDLKAELRGETSQSKDILKENEMLQREINMTRDELNNNNYEYERIQSNISDKRGHLIDLENKLRYAHDVIISLESENQQIELDLAQARAAADAQAKAYNELRHTFNILSNNGGDGQLQFSQSSPMISIPKIVMPSKYMKPSPSKVKASINLLPSLSKAFNQQAPSSNIKSYLAVRKAQIDLTSDINIGRGSINTKDQKVRFSFNSPANQSTLSTRMDQTTGVRRSDSMDLRIERRNQRNFFNENDSDGSYIKQNKFQSPNQSQQNNNRISSVNRNFVDSMGGILGMSQDNLQIINQRANAQGNNNFPLRKLQFQNNSLSGSPSKGIMKEYSQFDSPRARRFIDTDQSDIYGSSYKDVNNRMTLEQLENPRNGLTSPKNRSGLRGGPGNRSSQPLQLSSVKQKQQQPSQNKNLKAQNDGSWEQRMSQLPRNSAYKSQITFGEEGITTKESQDRVYNQTYEQSNNRNPFKMAKDYDVDIDNFNENDPQARTQIIKFKQQKIYELTDQRKILQSQVNHIPEYSKQVDQRQKKQELDAEIQKLTKRISMLKYDLKKLSCKNGDD